MPSEEPSPPAGPPATQRDQRRHPVSVLFGLASAARRLLIPGLIVLLFSRGSNLEIWLMVLFLPSAVAALVEYLSFRYRLGTDELIIKRVLVFRSERHIPYSRIQNIDQMQNPFHRLFRVAEVRVETASGTEPEAHIRVLSVDAIEEMRRRVFAGRRGADAAAAREEGAASPAGIAGEASRELVRLPLRELALLGIISNRGLAVALAIAGGLWQLNFWWSGSMNPLEDLTPALTQAFVGVDAVLIAAAVVLLVVLLRVLSIGWSILNFYDFRLVRVGDDLRTSRGLFTRVSATIPRQRIQLLSVSENLLHRLFGRVTVRVQTAGARGGEEVAVSRQHLVPLLRREDLADLLEEVQPEAGIDVAYRPVAPRASVRIFRKWLMVLVPVTAWFVYKWGLWWLAPFAAVVPLAYFSARFEAARLGWHLAPGAVLFRSGWWTRHVSLARYSKIQVVTVSQSPFDRRHRMASVRADTAGARLATHRIRIPYLPARDARSIFDRLGGEAASTEFRW